MRKIFLTGATGFIGGRLASALHAHGYDVTGIARSREAVRRHPLRDHIEWMLHDLSNPLPAVKGTFDVIVHTAAIGPEHGNQFPVYQRSNVDAMKHLLEFAMGNRIPKMIYLSSVSSYGEISSACIDEDTPVVNPVGYGLSKYIGEQLLQGTPEIEGISLRLPGVFGKGARSPWLARIMQAFQINQEVRIYAPDFQSNNFLYIDDLIAFVLSLLERGHWQERCLLLGMEQHISIRECASRVKEYTKSHSRIEVCESEKSPFSLNIRRAIGQGFHSRDFDGMLEAYFQEEAEMAD